MGLFGSGKPKKPPKRRTPKPVKPKAPKPRKTTQTPKRGNKPGS
jgi:hypothetical protein